MRNDLFCRNLKGSGLSEFPTNTFLLFRHDLRMSAGIKNFYSVVVGQWGRFPCLEETVETVPVVPSTHTGANERKDPFAERIFFTGKDHHWKFEGFRCSGGAFLFHGTGIREKGTGRNRIWQRRNPLKRWRM